MFLIYTALVVGAVFCAIQANDTSLLNRENSFYISNELFQPNLYMHKLDESEQGILAMIDLDNFKLINDHYSHLAGDFVLKEFSEIIRNGIREKDKEEGSKP